MNKETQIDAPGRAGRRGLRRLRRAPAAGRLAARTGAATFASVPSLRAASSSPMRIRSRASEYRMASYAGSAVSSTARMPRVASEGSSTAAGRSATSRPHRRAAAHSGCARCAVGKRRARAGRARCRRAARPPGPASAGSSTSPIVFFRPSASSTMPAPSGSAGTQYESRASSLRSRPSAAADSRRSATSATTSK